MKNATQISVLILSGATTFRLFFQVPTSKMAHAAAESRSRLSPGQSLMRPAQIVGRISLPISQALISEARLCIIHFLFSLIAQGGNTLYVVAVRSFYVKVLHSRVVFVPCLYRPLCSHVTGIASHHTNPRRLMQTEIPHRTPLLTIFHRSVSMTRYKVSQHPPIDLGPKS